MAKPQRCPRCGSKRVRNSYYTDAAEFTGRAAGAIVGMVISAPLNKTIGNLVVNNLEKGGKMLGKSFYDKRVCEDCKHTW